MQWFSSQKNWFKLLPTLLLLVLLLAPNLSSLEAAGIVPCEGLDCSTCDFISLGNEAIIWLLGIIFMIFAVLMAIAGFGLVTSGGNQSALSAAKSKFQNALIGILIVLSAWLLVDTIMHALLKGDGDLSVFNTGTYTGWGPWAQLECVPQVVPFTDNNNTPSPGQVPEATLPGACSIPPLSSIVDPLALEMEKGKTVIYNNPTLQTCATKFVNLVGGGAKVNSAYRPVAYQNHLYEIKDRWCSNALKTNNDSACSALKTAIGQEVTKHFGSSWSCGAVGKTSRHSAGTAVDIGGISNHNDPGIKQKAQASCLVWANYNDDPVHYNLISGCSCSP